MIRQSESSPSARIARLLRCGLPFAVALLCIPTLAAAQECLLPTSTAPAASEPFVPENDIPTHQPPADVACVNRANIRISYATADDSAPPTKTEVWYTIDNGRTWQQVAHPVLHKDGIGLSLPRDGLYGFFIVLENAGGASSPPPEPGTKPQQWLNVDQTAPLVQILQVNADPQFALNRELIIRWSVDDENLPDRPVTIHYRTQQTKAYRRLAEMLPDTGTHSWVVPDHLSGRLDLKITAVDTAGNSGSTDCDWLRLAANAVVDSRPRHTRTVAAGDIRRVPDVPSPKSQPQSKVKVAKRNKRPKADELITWDDYEPLPDEARKQYAEKAKSKTNNKSQGAADDARNRYDLGTWHRLRGEHAIAIARFRDALELDPELHAARNDLAALLFLRGDYETAEREFQRILESDPRHLSALKGLALVQARLRNFNSAAASLEKILIFAPDDSEAWLHLGDTRLFMGDRAGARDAWTHAESIESAPDEIKDRAQRRLTIYGADGLDLGADE